MNNIANNEILDYISNQLVSSLGWRISLSTATGFLDFIPIIGTVIGGIIDFIVNVPFLYKIGREAQNFAERRIREEGVKINILNQITGYTKSFEEVNKLADKEDWSRKLNFPENVQDH
jgi:uncharacterized protein (DUF697 family)